MKPLLIQLPGHAYADAVTELKHSIDCWHQLEAALLAASRLSPRNTELRAGYELLHPLDANLHAALDALTQEPSRNLPII